MHCIPMPVSLVPNPTLISICFHAPLFLLPTFLLKDVLALGIGKSSSNSLSTFCYLSAQRDSLCQLVDSRLAAEVRLLGGVLHAAQDDRQHHAGDQEDPYAVNCYFQVVWRCWIFLFLFRSWIAGFREGIIMPQS